MISDKLIVKAGDVFATSTTIYSGEGLTRKELKELFTAGFVERQLMRLDASGTLVYRWRLKSQYSELLARKENYDYDKKSNS